MKFEKMMNPPVDEITEEVVETQEVKPVIGVVCDCKNLRIREYPNEKAKEVCIIPVGAEVEIDIENSREDWYKVCTAYGFRGFCMKRFVTIK